MPGLCYLGCIHCTEGVLTVSRAVSNNSRLIGVLHAEFPWERLLSVIFTRLANRGSSYPFVYNDDGGLLYHPLLPSNVLKEVPVSELERRVNVR